MPCYASDTANNLEKTKTSQHLYAYFWGPDTPCFLDEDKLAKLHKNIDERKLG